MVPNRLTDCLVALVIVSVTAASASASVTDDGRKLTPLFEQQVMGHLNIPNRLRLQLHATDPDRLERRLGTPQSEGCVRTNGSFNAFLDRYAILDGDYEAATSKGQKFWVLSSTAQPTPWSGRYLVVVDTQAEQKPD